MIITISPAKKFAIMTSLVLVFLLIIHFAIVPNLHQISESQTLKVVLVVLAIVAIVITFSRITYSNLFRPFVPGPSYWKEEKYWTTLTIEKSLAGVGKVTYWFSEIFIFSVVLYTVFLHTIILYAKNIPSILNGTYVYELTETTFMGAPLVMLFLLLLFISIKLYNHLTTKAKSE